MTEKQQPLDSPQGGTGGGQSLPRGTPPRSYVVLYQSHDCWAPTGLHPGANPQAAIKRARGENPEMREALAEGAQVVAIPESYFEPLILTVETIERESFKPAKP